VSEHTGRSSESSESFGVRMRPKEAPIHRNRRDSEAGTFGPRFGSCRSLRRVRSHSASVTVPPSLGGPPSEGLGPLTSGQVRVITRPFASEVTWPRQGLTSLSSLSMLGPPGAASSETERVPPRGSESLSGIRGLCGRGPACTALCTFVTILACLRREMAETRRLKNSRCGLERRERVNTSSCDRQTLGNGLLRN
jgi:hypothetical protein